MTGSGTSPSRGLVPDGLVPTSSKCLVSTNNTPSGDKIWKFDKYKIWKFFMIFLMSFVGIIDNDHGTNFSMFDV